MANDVTHANWVTGKWRYKSCREYGLNRNSWKNVPSKFRLYTINHSHTTSNSRSRRIYSYVFEVYAYSIYSPFPSFFSKYDATFLSQARDISVTFYDCSKFVTNKRICDIIILIKKLPRYYLTFILREIEIFHTPSIFCNIKYLFPQTSRLLQISFLRFQVIFIPAW